MGERKLVTVLCCTVANAPALVEALGLDAAHSLMQAIYSLALDEMQRYDGTIQHVTSNDFVVLFGAPVAQEDHARRAVLAALGLQQRLRQSQPELRLPSGADLEVSMALHSGLVALGQIGTDAHRMAMVVGETPMVAATLARRTAPGTLVASETTIRLVQGEVRTAALPPWPGDEPTIRVPVYQILQFVPQRLPLAASEGRPYSPFVGREADLAVLYARLALVERGQGHVVGIRGEPGIGKSRLLFEFRHGLSPHRVTYMQGRCQSYGSMMPYLPMRDLVRGAVGLAEAESATAVSARVEARLQEMGMASAPWTPYLLHLLGRETLPTPAAGLSPEHVKERTFEALHQLLFHHSRQQPCVVEIEDLHWIDATSEAYLAALVERLAALPLLLLVTSRPGYRPPGLDKSYVTQIALQPLGPDESRQVVRAVLRRTPLATAFEQEILAKAEGNAFFLEELARAMAAQGSHTATLQVPDTIQAVIAARIDRLPPEVKQLLQTAAVIGATVPLAVLQAMTGFSEAVLRRSLAHLQAAEFLYETPLLAELTYTFKHILIHEVAYGSLLQEQRRALHAGVVEALERLYADHLQAWTERLAHHALHGGVWDKAYGYFRQAGNSAIARSAHREAVACLEQALVALQHLPERRDTIEQAIDLRFSLRGVLVQLGELDRALTYLHEAETLAQTLDDPHRLGHIASYMARYCFLMGEHAVALRAGQRALSLAATLDDISLQVAGNMYLGQIYHALGDYPQALHVLRQNVTLLVGPLLQERFGMANLPAVTSRAFLAYCLAELGQFDAGVACGAEGLRLAEAAGHANSLAIACLGLGRLYLNQGALPAAIAVLERGLTLCDTAQIALLRPAVAAALGYAYTLADRHEAALPLLRQLQQTALLPTPLSSLVLTWVGEISLRNGRPQEASALAGRALDLARQRQERGNQAWTLRLLGALAMGGDPVHLAQAHDWYTQARVLAEALGMRPLLAHCHLALGILAHRLDQRARAEAACSTAVMLFRSLHMTLWLAQAENVLGQVALMDGR
jgi:class 3 adenylate cyclase/tetratricopeptide (TPR) repeat protein